MKELVQVLGELIHHKAVLHFFFILSQEQRGEYHSVAPYPESLGRIELQYMNLHEESLFIKHECLR